MPETAGNYEVELFYNGRSAGMYQYTLLADGTGEITDVEFKMGFIYIEGSGSSAYYILTTPSMYLKSISFKLNGVEITDFTAFTLDTSNITEDDKIKNSLGQNALAIGTYDIGIKVGDATIATYKLVVSQND